MLIQWLHILRIVHALEGGIKFVVCLCQSLCSDCLGHYFFN